MREITSFSIYNLNKPLTISINDVLGHFYASNEEYEIYSDGDTEEEAVENFKVLLSEAYCRAKKLVELVE